MVKLFFLLRKWINEKRLKIFSPVYRLIGLLYSSAIPLSCHIGKNITFMHGLFGDNITLYQHVTIWEDIEDYTTVIFDKSSFRKVLNNA